MNNREFIRRFSKITMTKICKKENLDSRSLYTFNEEKLKRVREDIESEIAKLYIKED